MFESTITLLYFALGLGMLHALDADHILTISGISAHNNQWKQVIRYSTHWVIGHSVSLLGIGFCVFLLGLSFNKIFSQYAEIIVAIILAMIGIRLLITSNNDNVTNSESNEETTHFSRKALAIGSVHGLAGTASILALIPVTKINDPYLAISYLIIFSIGILLSMLIFGGVLRHTISKIMQYYPKSITFVQTIAGLLAIVFSFYLFYAVAS